MPMQVSSRIMSVNIIYGVEAKLLKIFNSTFTLIVYRVVLALHHFSSLNRIPRLGKKYSKRSKISGQYNREW